MKYFDYDNKNLVHNLTLTTENYNLFLNMKEKRFFLPFYTNNLLFILYFHIFVPILCVKHKESFCIFSVSLTHKK